MKYPTASVFGRSTILAAATFLACPGQAHDAGSADPQLASAALHNGENLRAIALLVAELERQPNDPALLINLGIAQARIGNERDARANFERALSHDRSVDLETADGRHIDSHRLARLAL